MKIHQEHGALPPVLSELFPQLVLQQLVMEMQALSPLAGPVCIDHAGTVQRDQDIIAKGFVDLAVIDVRRVNGADLAALPQGKVDIFPRFPLAGKNFPPPAGGARKQVALKVLGGLFPPHTVAAFQPIPEHIPKTENLRQCAQAVISGLFPGLPGRFPALVSRLPALLACHIFLFAPQIVVL